MTDPGVRDKVSILGISVSDRTGDAGRRQNSWPGCRQCLAWRNTKVSCFDIRLLNPCEYPALYVSRFGPAVRRYLRDFFVREAGFKKANVFLLDYASMDDEATFKDFADKLEADYNRLFNKTERINVVCHSTGALVVRAWLVLRRTRQRELGLKLDCPVKRLLILAPANFGVRSGKNGASLFWANSVLLFLTAIRIKKIFSNPANMYYRDWNPPVRFSGIYQK